MKFIFFQIVFENIEFKRRLNFEGGKTIFSLDKIYLVLNFMRIYARKSASKIHMIFS